MNNQQFPHIGNLIFTVNRVEEIQFPDLTDPVTGIGSKKKGPWIAPGPLEYKF